MGQLYSIVNGMTPIEVESKNNLERGRVLKLEGYNCPRYAIIENQGVNERFSGYGARYECLNLDNLTFSIHDAYSLEWLENQKDSRIQTYITDEFIEPDLLTELIERANEKEKQKKKAQDKAEVERKVLVEKGKALFDRYIPKSAPALIIAQHHIDDCDMMTDYFNHKTVETVILAWSKHTRDLFPEMRKAASKIPETAHLGPGKGHFSPVVKIGENITSNGSAYWKGSISHWHQELAGNHWEPVIFSTREEAEDYIKEKGEPESISFDGNVIPFYWDINEGEIEHREKYSMGSGYYLKDGHSDSSGWAVKKIMKYGESWGEDLYVSIARRCVFQDAKPQVKVEAPIAPVDGVQVSKNEEKNGIEVRFPDKPEQGIIDYLKSRGFRWSRYAKVWWKKFDEALMMEVSEKLNA